MALLRMSGYTMIDILIANTPSKIAYSSPEKLGEIMERLRQTDFGVPELSDPETKAEFLSLFNNYCLGRYRCPLSMGRYGNSYETRYDDFNRKVDMATEFWANFA